MAVNSKEWNFMMAHMPAVKRAIGDLPMRLFLGIEDASPKQDMEQATDLVMEMDGGTMAVRVRRNRFWAKALAFGGPDLSIRYENKGRKTEIHKLREGFGDWYFYGYSANDKDSLIMWALIDLNTVRKSGILEEESIASFGFQIHPNRDIKGRLDGTSGLYIPLSMLAYDYDAIIASDPRYDSR